MSSGSILTGQTTAADPAASVIGVESTGGVIKALSTNTVSVWVGPSGVTASTGYELAPSEFVSTDLLNISGKVYVFCATASQKVCLISGQRS